MAKNAPAGPPPMTATLAPAANSIRLLPAVVLMENGTTCAAITGATAGPQTVSASLNPCDSKAGRKESELVDKRIIARIEIKAISKRWRLFRCVSQVIPSASEGFLSSNDLKSPTRVRQWRSPESR